MISVLGIDLSLNHAGLCWLDVTGPAFDFIATETKHRDKKLQSETAIRFSDELAALKRTHKGKIEHERYNQARLLVWVKIAEWIAEEAVRRGVSIVALEDYAFGAVSSSSLQIAEVSGQVRAATGRIGVKLRLYTPGQVKKWACGNGAAKKAQMMGAAALAGLGDLERLTHQKGSDLDGPGTDMVDAYFLADLARAEHRVRHGHLLLSDLDPAAIEVFNMVSRSHPVNLLARPYC